MPLIQEPDKTYHSRWELSNSMLGEMEPEYRFYAKYFSDNPTVRKETEALTEGAAMHMLLLEPDEFENRFAMAPDVNKRTKAGKEEFALFCFENADKTILTAKSFDVASEMANAVFRHDQAAEYLRAKGVNEVTVTFDYDESGLKCRGRIDKLLIEQQFIMDIKRSRDASPNGFSRAITQYQYHRQGMWYADGLSKCGDERVAGAADWPFVWMAIEPTPPYCVGLYTMDDEQRAHGQHLYEQKVEKLKRCLETNKWPHYTENVQIIHLPSWAYNDYTPTEVIT